MQEDYKEVIDLLWYECKAHKTFILCGFVVVTLIALGVGMVWPKEYSSRSTIILDEKNILKPLLEGSAVTTSVEDHIKVVRETIFARAAMEKLLKEDYWKTDNLSSYEIEELIQKINKNTMISNIGNRMIEIRYKSSDPKIAFKTTKFLTDYYIDISQENKRHESKAAFDFISKQADIYHNKVKDAEKKMELFRSQNMGETSDTLVGIHARIRQLKRDIEQNELEINEAKIVNRSLQQRLNADKGGSSTISQEDEYISRIAILQSQLNELRLNYNESYPDIVTLKTQINALVKNKRAGVKLADIDNNNLPNNSAIILKNQIIENNTRIKRLTARIEHIKNILKREQALVQRITSLESKVLALQRDHEVNSDQYVRLMQRKESARVSMNIDLANQGTILRIGEHASTPILPEGARFFYFILAGISFGLIIPVSLLYIMMVIDGKVRSTKELIEQTQVPVLGIATFYATPREVSRRKYWIFSCSFTVCCVLAIYGYVIWMRIQ